MSREVARYKMHPDYAHTDSGEADLAILVLRTSVNYSPVIKPICLWTGSISLDNVIGKNGTVVGWGLDEHGNYTADPRLVSVPIVKQVRPSFLLSRYLIIIKHIIMNSNNFNDKQGSLKNKRPKREDDNTPEIFIN